MKKICVLLIALALLSCKKEPVENAPSIDNNEQPAPVVNQEPGTEINNYFFDVPSQIVDNGNGTITYRFDAAEITQEVINKAYVSIHTLLENNGVKTWRTSTNHAYYNGGFEVYFSNASMPSSYKQWKLTIIR
jgi:hypothetical protein